LGGAGKEFWLKKYFWDSKKEKEKTNNCHQKIIGWGHSHTSSFMGS
jgi:hypothetical protein